MEWIQYSWDQERLWTVLGAENAVFKGLKGLKSQKYSGAAPLNPPKPPWGAYSTPPDSPAA